MTRLLEVGDLYVTERTSTTSLRVWRVYRVTKTKALIGDVENLNPLDGPHTSVPRSYRPATKAEVDDARRRICDAAAVREQHRLAVELRNSDPHYKLAQRFAGEDWESYTLETLQQVQAVLSGGEVKQ